jgi:6-phospho-3-hexuloisomerase
VIGSGSGRTASLVQHSERAQALNAQVALITAAGSSPLASHADHIVHIAASSSKLEGTDGVSSIQLPGSLFEQALGILLDTLIVQLMVDLGISAEEMLARHANLE